MQTNEHEAMTRPPGSGPESSAQRDVQVGIAGLFDLRRDLDNPENIDDNVRAGVDVAGTNLWVLFFAILVASV
ncbi:hypothetical protein [Roseateles asaccharophilus]|uniref:Uncharacterized protein n=1 Tax=Roseateles asaccharophilus TaxID=582607 RepID=A0ABU2AEZ4_9BURK|nr:hypothetical protein [Roseateles asaccharophilus]MDR7335037.1 hypothetical protein [Roseateles asaccharophilus]